MDEFLYSLDVGDRMAIRGGFCHAGDKQAYIRIGIDTTNSILNKNFKQIIRHEIIHYYLWLVNLPFDDNSLEFWCMCYAFDAGAKIYLYDDLDKNTGFGSFVYETNMAQSLTACVDSLNEAQSLLNDMSKKQ